MVESTPVESVTLRFGPDRLPLWQLGVAIFAIAVATLLEVANIAPRGATPSAGFIVGIVLGLTRRRTVDGFAAGFLAGYAGYVTGLPLAFLVQYALNPEAGILGWFLLPLVGLVLAIVFGALLALVSGAGGFIGSLVSRWKSSAMQARQARRRAKAEP